MARDNRKPKKAMITTHPKTHTKSRNRPSRRKIDLPGRPVKSDKQQIHQTIYGKVKQINETTAYMIKSFSPRDVSTLNLHLMFDEVHKAFDSTDYKTKIITPEQKFKYGNKYTLPYFVHYFTDIKKQKIWYPNSILNIVIYWLDYMDILSAKDFQQIEKLKNQCFDIQFFCQEENNENSLLNLMIILVMDLGVLQNLIFCRGIDAQADHEKKLEQDLRNQTYVITQRFCSN